LGETACNETGPNFTIRVNMNHGQALSTHASERYLLGEMSEPERFDFEDHYFGCGECAQDVRAGSALARGIQAVYAEDAAHPRTQVISPQPLRSRRFAWLTPSALVPLAASLMLASVVGYQSLVLIPSLRSSRALTPVVLRAAARGEEQTLDLRSREPYFVFSLDVNAAEPDSPLIYEASPEKGPVRSNGPATAPPPGSPLIIVIPHSDFNQAGAWTLVLRTPHGAEIARYPFSVRLN
jgi:hypothetical protein